MVSSNNSSYYKNERKKGYIELIKDLWEEKGYGYLELKSENLGDQASRLEKKAVSLSPVKERLFKKIVNLLIKTMFPGKLKMLVLQTL